MERNFISATTRGREGKLEYGRSYLASLQFPFLASEPLNVPHFSGPFHSRPHPQGLADLWLRHVLPLVLERSPEDPSRSTDAELVAEPYARGAGNLSATSRSCKIEDCIFLHL